MTKLFGLIVVLLLSTLSQSEYVIQNKIQQMENHQFLQYYNRLENETNQDQKCQPLTLPICQQLGYNSTRISKDLFYGEIQPYFADKYLSKFQGEYSCSKDLLFLLCTLVNPICFKGFSQQIKPCRSVCENVKQECSDVMNKLLWTWPSFMDCNELPNFETGICIKPSSLVQKEFANSLQPVIVKPQPTCEECRKLRRFKSFRQFVRADYALEVKYVSKTKTFNNRLKLQFLVKKVFKSEKIATKKHEIIDIWVKNACICHQLEFDRKYIILGKSRFIDGSQKRRFVLSQKTIVEPKTRHFVQVLKRWAQQIRHESNSK